MKYYIITVKSRNGTACEHVAYKRDDIGEEVDLLLNSLAEQHIIEGYKMEKVPKTEWERDNRAYWGIFS